MTPLSEVAPQIQGSAHPDYLALTPARHDTDGFFAAVRLAEFSEGVVLPHEETAPGPKKDRLQLMETTEANLSPIFCLYSDPDGRIESALSAAAARQVSRPPQQ